MSERERWPDPVRRVKDEMDMHAVTGNHGYAAFNLTDGSPVTHDSYPSRERARHYAEKLTRDNLLILEISPDGMPYNEANAVLLYERTLIGMGVRSPDVDNLETEENSGLLSMPRTRHDRRRMAAQLRKGKPLYDPSVPYANLPHYLRRVQ